MRPLPIGKDSFRKLRNEGCYYVDKTPMIAELLEQKAEVTLITRPRRFGKTLNLDMLREFFDMEANSAELFIDLEIMNTPWAERLNSRPVLAFSYKDCKSERPVLIRQIKAAIETQYDRYEAKIYPGLSKQQKLNYDEIRKTLAEKSSQDLDPLWNSMAFMSKVMILLYGAFW